MPTDIIVFPVKPPSCEDFKSLRLKHGLSHIQMASCLELSVSTVESWEQGRRRITLDLSTIEKHISEYFFEGKNVDDCNILFGVLPISSARHMLEKSCEEISFHYGVKTEIWRKYEQNREKIPPKLKEAIERDISEIISKIQCSVSFNMVKR